MCGGARLGPQQVSLRHPESVLLVDNHQRQVVEVDPLLEQRVGAHDDPRRAVLHPLQRRLSSRGAVPGLPVSKAIWVAVVGGAQHPAQGQVAQQVAEGVVVLGSQHLPSAPGGPPGRRRR